MDEQKPRRRRTEMLRIETPIAEEQCEVRKPQMSQQSNLQTVNQKRTSNLRKRDKRVPWLIALAAIEGLLITVILCAATLYAMNGWSAGGVSGFISGLVSTPTPIPTLTPTVVPTPTPTPMIEYVYVTAEPTATPVPTAIPTPVIEYIYITPEPTEVPTPTPIPTAVPTPVIEYVYVTTEPTDTPVPTLEPTKMITPKPTPKPTPVKIDVTISSVRFGQDAIGTTELYIRFTNEHASETIDRVDFTAKCYDSYGELIKGYGVYEGSNMFFEAQSIRPGKTTSSDYYYTMYGFDGIKSVSIAIQKYHTKSGRTVEISEDDLQWKTFSK